MELLIKIKTILCKTYWVQSLVVTIVTVCKSLSLH